MSNSVFCIQLGKRIKNLREEKEITQEMLAEKAEYASGKGMISKIENGNTEPPVSKLFKIADALGTNIAYLMGWDDSLKTLTQQEYELLLLFRNATNEGKMLAIGNLQASQQDARVG